MPQSGNTGHVGGQTPREGHEDVLLSLERMNRVREVDLAANTMTVDAGCILAELQKVAEENRAACFRCRSDRREAARSAAISPPMPAARRCLPMAMCASSASAWKSCCRPARSGTGSRKLKKDNTGYDLRDLFIGAEGTLGIITAAVLKLFPQPRGHQVAFCRTRECRECAGLLQAGPGSLRQRADRFRTDGAARRRDHDATYPRRARSAGFSLSLVCAGRHLDDRQRGRRAPG